MKYSEFFYTIQGEGKLLGVPSVFFRTSYCNLRCVWCFVEDTQVLMADFTEKSIQDIKVGDVVLSADKGGVLCAKNVLNTMNRFVDEIVEVVTDSGCVLTTPTHTFKTMVGWTQAQKLSSPVEKIGFMMSDSEARGLLGNKCWRTQEMPDVRRIQREAKVYNLTIQDTHCYFANRFLVANCDTPFTSWNPENKDITVAEAVAAITQYGCKHVVITGGEPFVQVEALTELCRELDGRGHHITIETNATIFAPVAAHLISMSPKLQNSNPPNDNRYFRMHERGRICPDVIRKFLDQYECQVKFVVDQPEDIEEIKALQADIPIPAETIVLMPQGMTPEELHPKQDWLVEICKANGYRYSPRIHIDIWGKRRGV